MLVRHGTQHYKKDMKTLEKVQKKRHEILLAELCSTCQCYRYVGHTWMEDIGREEGGIKINNDVQDTGLEITFSLFPIMLISSHDFLLIK
jgi:hypothetical protein